jgi:lauroyl/myristoyl acyltransferase
MSGVTDAVTEWGFEIGWTITKRLPERASRRSFEFIADQMWRRRGPSVVQLERNLARIDPAWTTGEIRELSHETLRGYLRYWNEAFRLPSWSTERIRDTFDLMNKEWMDEAVRTGTGAILVPGHMANWDHAGAWAAQRYGGITTVAERLKPEGLFDQFLAYRQTLGMEVFPIGHPDLVRDLARRLNEGRIVALLGDRDISRNGIEVSFFGQPAKMPAGPAILSLMTDAPLYPVSMWFDGDRVDGHIYERVVAPAGVDRTEQIRQMTQQVASCFEDGIRKRPTSWHMLQKVWLADQTPRNP